MALQYDEFGNLYDDGQPLPIERAPLAITVNPSKPEWVDSMPTPLANPDSTAFDIAAFRTARGVKGTALPVDDDRFKAFGPANPERPSYIMEPDLVEMQGGQQMPAGLMQSDSGRLYYQDQPALSVPVIRRPNLLPIAQTPEGYKFAVPRLLDIVGNVMGNVAGGRVAAQSGEMVLGSGMARTMTENPKYKMVPVDYDPFATDWYHGSVRIDRMDGKIDPRRATSGPMPYFSDDPKMASAYAEGKKPDTSLQKNDPGDSVHRYFTVSPKDLGHTRSRTPYTVEDSWNYLKPEQRKEILEKYHRIGYKDREMSDGPYTLHNEPYSGLSGQDHYEYVLKNEARGNPLKALRIIWHDGGSLVNSETDLAEIYKLAGYPHKISEANAPWVEARGVMAAKLNMKNPLLTDQKDVIVNEILPKLEQAFKNDRTRKPAYSDSDMWDKNYRYTPKEWVAQAKEDYLKGDNSYVWTTIPDKITAELKKLGFDGIIDTGGKGGGQEHRVAIPFDIPGIVTSKYSGKTLYSNTKGTVAAQAARQIEKPNQMGFYSTLERAVGSAKINLATPEQWLGYLKNQPGVKVEELQYVLGDMPKEGMLSKEQLNELIKTNNVGLKEKILGGKLDEAIKKWRAIDMPAARQEKIDAYRAFEKVLKEAGGDVNDSYVKEASQRLAKANSKIEELEFNKPHEPIPTNYHQYQLPGGENYQEMLLRLPQKEETAQIAAAKRIKEISQRLKDIQDHFDSLYGGNTQAVLKARKELAVEEAALKKEHLEQHKIATTNVNQNFKAPHFDEHGTNLLAHIRMNDRIVGNQKSLHIEEIQSDWHQKGRKEGYKGEKEKLQSDFDKIEEKLMASNDEKMLGLPTIKEVLAEAVDKKLITKSEADTYKRFTDIEHGQAVPDAPFKKNWDELALKRIIHKAAKDGYDAISWTPGEAQALRYQNEIRQKLNKIDWAPRQKHLEKWHDDNAKGPGVTHIGVDGESGGTWMNIDKDGNIISAKHKELVGKTLDDAVGKDLAKQILEKPEGSIDAKGYVMGAEGMKGFYDKMLVDKMNGLVKKYGGKVEQKQLPLQEYEKEDLRRKLMETTRPDEIAIARHSKKWDELVEEIEAQNKPKIKQSTIYKQAGLARINQIEDELSNLHGRMVRETVDRIISKEGKPIHYLHLTPELKAKAVDEGFSMFSSVPITTPVDFDPFKDDNKKIKLVPVPFTPEFK